MPRALTDINELAYRVRYALACADVARHPKNSQEVQLSSVLEMLKAHGDISFFSFVQNEKTKFYEIRVSLGMGHTTGFDVDLSELTAEISAIMFVHDS
jgi:hypothetical protein